MDRKDRLNNAYRYLLGNNLISSQVELAHKMDASESTVSSAFNGSERALTDRFLKRFNSAFGNIFSLDWLCKGIGDMLIDSDAPVQSYAKQSKSDERFYLVPLINIDSVGGMHSSNSIDVTSQYVIQQVPFSEAREGDVAICQSGNSMYPTIPPGSVLLIREVSDWREYFGYGGIFVLLLKDGRRITKEIRRYDEDPKNYVWCVSYNPDVADEELPKSMIAGVWKVVKYVADFGW